MKLNVTAWNHLSSQVIHRVFSGIRKLQCEASAMMGNSMCFQLELNEDQGSDRKSNEASILCQFFHRL